MSTVSCPSYQCADLTAYPEQDSCATFKGGSNQLVLFKCGLDVDISNGAAVAAAIDAGNAIHYTNIDIQWEAPSPVTTPSFVGCVSDIVVGYDHVINFIDRNVQQGAVDHYNSVNSATGFTFGAMLVYECSEDRTSYIDDAAITLQGGRIMPGNSELQRFAHQLNYRSEKSNLQIMTANPSGLWN